MSERRRWEICQDAIADIDRRVLGFEVRRRDEFVASTGGVGWPDPSSWHFFAFSYQRAFDVLWDAAYARFPLRLDYYPLLFVGRLSIELWLKAAIAAVTQAEPRPGHQLSALWSELVTKLSDADRDAWIDGGYPELVEGAIQVLASHDEKGDRFRYPTAIGGDSYPATEVDLEELYRAHTLITGFCDAVLTQSEVERDFDAPDRGT